MALLEAKRKEMEVKRATAASKGAKVFYKVTVKVFLQDWQQPTYNPLVLLVSIGCCRV